MLPEENTPKWDLKMFNIALSERLDHCVLSAHVSSMRCSGFFCRQNGLQIVTLRLAIVEN